jgi:3',5'-cyclic AMP phosphodiesterase CpdA
MKKIVHFSDLHCGFENLTSRWQSIVTRLIFHKQPASNYVVVITGDLVEDATRPGIFLEAKMSIDRLIAAGFRVLIAMGNHDCGTGIFGYPELAQEFNKTFFGTGSVQYPIRDIIDDIAFLGLNSMAEELNEGDRLGAEGELGGTQLDRLSSLLHSSEVTACRYRVVYLHHHPFHPMLGMQLKDARALHETIHNVGIDAILFGHNHEGLTWNGGWGIRRAYDAGSSTHKEPNKPSPHRVIDLSQDPSHDYDACF